MEQDYLSSARKSFHQIKRLTYSTCTRNHLRKEIWIIFHQKGSYFRRGGLDCITLFEADLVGADQED